MARKPSTLKEKLFMSNIKELPCCICGHPPISDCHHIVNGYRLGNMFCLPLCKNCHTGDDGFSGKNRGAWDKSLKNQLELLRLSCKKLGVKPPEYKSKIISRNPL